MNNYKRKFSFLDAEGLRVRLEAEITHRNGYPEFTLSGSRAGGEGQILDHIKPKTNEQRQIISLWRDYHLTNLDEIPANISFLPSFEGHLDGLIDYIEKEEEEEEKEEEKTEDEKLIEKMEEEGIDEGNLEACKAYLEATGAEDLEDFEEAYQGEWSDDEEFAQNMAEEIGAIDENASWPNNCIDWEKASRELMYDYTEANGFYFRNL